MTWPARYALTDKLVAAIPAERDPDIREVLIDCLYYFRRAAAGPLPPRRPRRLVAGDRLVNRQALAPASWDAWH